MPASKPRRPPAYPLFAGLVWRQAEMGRTYAGDPLAQWAYICPEHPEGLEASHVIWQSVEAQTELVWTWFQANFLPFDPADPWFSFAETGEAVGGPFAPDYRSPDAILSEEFGETAAPAVVAGTTKAFADRAPLWVLKPPPLPITETPDEAAVQATLERLRKAGGQAPSAGHNGGPPLADAAPLAQIEGGMQQVEYALNTSRAEGQRSRAVAAAIKAAQEMWSGALRAIGAMLAGGAMGGLALAAQATLPALHRALIDALTTLARWWLGT